MTRSRLLVIVLVIAALVAAFGGCRQSDPPDPNGTTAPEGTARSVLIYFACDGELEPVERTVAASDDALLRAAELLIAGPTSDEAARGLSPVLPGSARVLSSVQSGDTLILDLSQELLTAAGFPVSAQAESLALEALALTFGQFSNIRHVRVLVEGRQQGTVGGREVADFWGHVGLPPTISTRKAAPKPEAAHTVGAPADGLKLTDVRWSYGEGRLRIVFDIANSDGTAADVIPFTVAERSADGTEILVFINGMRGLDARAPRHDAPLSITSPIASALEWIAGEEYADDQMFPFTLKLKPEAVTDFQLFGLTGPTRIVLDVYGQ